MGGHKMPDSRDSCRSCDEWKTSCVTMTAMSHAAYCSDTTVVHANFMGENPVTAAAHGETMRKDKGATNTSTAADSWLNQRNKEVHLFCCC